MRTIDKTKARHYILAGLYPDLRDTMAICAIQDAFAGLYHEEVICLLADPEVCTDALRLFRLIWDDTKVDSLKREADAARGAYDYWFVGNEYVMDKRHGNVYLYWDFSRLMDDAELLYNVTTIDGLINSGLYEVVPA